MDLFFRSFGDERAKPLVILHGLLGSSRNWQAAGAALGDSFRVYALDLRNHGDSPHDDEHSYELMAEDVLRWMDRQGLERAIVMGHSMGGKLAMKIACENQSRLSKLIVVDIAPKTYPNSHDDDLAAMLAIDLGRIESRKEADERLKDAAPDWGLRQFLLTNFVRDSEGGFRWQANIRAIYESRRRLESSSLQREQRFEGETLFILGERSNYFASDDVEQVRSHFPASSIERIPDCGHNPHFEKRDAFVEIVKRFCI